MDTDKMSLPELLALKSANVVGYAAAGHRLDVEMLSMTARALAGEGATPAEVLALTRAWAQWVRAGQAESASQADVQRRLYALAASVEAGLEGT